MGALSGFLCISTKDSCESLTFILVYWAVSDTVCQDSMLYHLIIFESIDTVLLIALRCPCEILLIASNHGLGRYNMPAMQLFFLNYQVFSYTVHLYALCVILSLANVFSINEYIRKCFSRLMVHDIYL